MKRHAKVAAISIVGLFAVIGVAFVIVFIAMQFGLFNVRGSIDARNQFFLASSTPEALAQPCDDKTKSVCDWNQTPEWDVVKGGLEKDAAVIQRVARETGIPARLIASVVIPEQIRFFTSEREVFKRYFEPLKVLDNNSRDHAFLSSGGRSLCLLRERVASLQGHVSQNRSAV